MKENIEIWIKKVIEGVVNIFIGLLFSIFCGLSISNETDRVTRILPILFFICGLIISIKGLNNDNVSAKDLFEDYNKLDIIDKIFSKLIWADLFLAWFVFLIAFDYMAIRDGQTFMIIISVFFWVVGIFGVIKKFRK